MQLDSQLLPFFAEDFDLLLERLIGLYLRWFLHICSIAGSDLPASAIKELIRLCITVDESVDFFLIVIKITILVFLLRVLTALQRCSEFVLFLLENHLLLFYRLLVLIVSSHLDELASDAVNFADEFILLLTQRCMLDFKLFNVQNSDHLFI